jgi:hypothetical protein
MRAGDAGPAISCSSNEECDDGIYCNGAETCTGRCLRGRASRTATTASRAPTDACSVDSDVCTHLAPDMDGDGFGDASCVDRRGVPTGEDCDDGDAERRAPETSRSATPTISTRTATSARAALATWTSDGFEDFTCCNATPWSAASSLNCGNDCDDGSENVRPHARRSSATASTTTATRSSTRAASAPPGATRQCPQPGACAAGVRDLRGRPRLLGRARSRPVDRHRATTSTTTATALSTRG